MNQFTAQIMDGVKFGIDFMLLQANPAPYLGNDMLHCVLCNKYCWSQILQKLLRGTLNLYTTDLTQQHNNSRNSNNNNKNIISTV